MARVFKKQTTTKLQISDVDQKVEMGQVWKMISESTTE